MKINQNYILILLILLTTIVNVDAQSEHHYLIKSAQVNYIYSGDFSGNESLVFDDYGSAELLIKKLHASNDRKTTETKTIRLHNTLVEINMHTLTKQIIPLQHNINTNKTVDMLKAGNFKKTGTESIAGFTCQKYSGEMGMMCIWKGIVLKSEINITDKKMIKTAALVDTVSTLEPSLFSIK